MASDATGNTGPTEQWYITAERGEGIKDERLLTRSDPYLKIEFGGKNVQTHPVKNDHSPNWNETFHFTLTDAHAQDIKIRLMDDKFGPDEAIGNATISREDLPSFSGDEKYLQVPIYHNQQITGVVHLRVKQIIEGQPTTSKTYQSSDVNYSQQQQPQFQQQSEFGLQQPPLTYDGLNTNVGQTYQQSTNLQSDTFRNPLDQNKQNLNQGNSNYYGNQNDQQRF